LRRAGGEEDRSLLASLSEPRSLTQHIDQEASPQNPTHFHLFFVVNLHSIQEAECLVESYVKYIPGVRAITLNGSSYARTSPPLLSLWEKGKKESANTDRFCFVRYVHPSVSHQPSSEKRTGFSLLCFGKVQLKLDTAVVLLNLC
jgi:hypothetical protein